MGQERPSICQHFLAATILDYSEAEFEWKKHAPNLEEKKSRDSS